AFPRHFFEYLKMKPGNFYREAEPTWKMGIRFLWGPREKFYYTFSFEHERRLPQMSRNNGFYYTDEFPWRAEGLPQFHNNHAYHIENKKLVAWLENRCRDNGVEIVDATVKPELGGEGIAA